VRSLVNQDPRERQVSKPRVNVDAEITEILRTFALANPRQGYRKARRAVLEAGYRVNLKKIHRLWREAGLKVPLHKPKNKRAGHGLPMGAHHPTGPNITWAMDFQFDWNYRRQSPQTTQHHRRVLSRILRYPRRSLDRCRRGDFGSRWDRSGTWNPGLHQNGQWTFSSSRMP